MTDVKSVIIIDDNESDLRLNQEIIKSANIFENVLPFGSAKDALNYLRLIESMGTHQSVPVPQIIILDINMPKMDGFEFLEELKKLKIAKQNLISVFMLSSTTNPNEINKAITHPIVRGLITKPLTVAKLIALLKN